VNNEEVLSSSDTAIKHLPVHVNKKSFEKKILDFFSVFFSIRPLRFRFKTFQLP